MKKSNNAVSNTNIWKVIRENWVVLAFIIQTVVQWNLNNGKLIEHESRITKNEEMIERVADENSEIKTRLASIDTSLLFLKEAIINKER